jgi:predicted secreted protein
MKNILSRRKVLINAFWASVASQWSSHTQAQASVDKYSQKYLLSQPWKKEGITIEIPPLADTGNSIPMRIQIESNTQAKLRSFEIIAPENPNPMVLRVSLPTPETKIKMATRIRLALSQDVWVVARLDDGSTMAQSANCVVTLNACFDAT